MIMKILLPGCLILLFAFGCKEDKEIMTGEITGIVSLFSQQNIKLSDCSGVRVNLYRNAEHLGDTLTDTYGEFHFRDLPYGKYQVDLQKDNYIREDVSTEFDHVGGTKTTIINYRMFEIPTYILTIDSFKIIQGGYWFDVYLKVNDDTLLPFVNYPKPYFYNLKGFSGSSPDFAPENSLGFVFGYLNDQKPYPGIGKKAVYGNLINFYGPIQPPGYDSVYLKVYPIAFGQGYNNGEISNKALGKPSNVVVFHW
jgi:hypothetical protein